MVVATDSERVRHSRKLVFELLASSVKMDLVDAETMAWMDHYGADPTRFGEPADPTSNRDDRHAGHHEIPDGATAANVAQPTKIDNDLYVRDYSRCILCYKCVEACGEDAQNSFAIAVSGRGFDARISTEFDVALTNSACVFCGNCIGVCPTGALMFRSEHEMRKADIWDEDAQSVTRTVCSYCGVGCNLDLHVQDNRIVKVTSPLDDSVTEGHLCIKGRFGYRVRPGTRGHGQHPHRHRARSGANHVKMRDHPHLGDHQLSSSPVAGDEEPDSGQPDDRCDYRPNVSGADRRHQKQDAAESKRSPAEQGELIVRHRLSLPAVLL